MIALLFVLVLAIFIVAWLGYRKVAMYGFFGTLIVMTATLLFHIAPHVTS